MHIRIEIVIGVKQQIYLMKYTTEKIYIPAGERKLKLLILSPKNRRTDRTGLLWIHGGGYVTGMAGMVHMSRAKNIVQKYGAVVISPRLSSRRKSSLPRCARRLSYGAYISERTLERARYSHGPDYGRRRECRRRTCGGAMYV